MLYYMATECKVSIIGGGFKPPHLGHLTMIFDGISANDITVLSVGSGNRDGITRRLSKDILNVYLHDLNQKHKLVYEETLFGFIILKKQDKQSSEFEKVYQHLQSVLMSVTPEDLLDSLILDELHIDTITKLINNVEAAEADAIEQDTIIDKKSKSPIGLTFYLFQVLEEYVKVNETLQLSLIYYVGAKDAVARGKIFSRFPKDSNPSFDTRITKNTSTINTKEGGGEQVTSGTETRRVLKEIIAVKETPPDQLLTSIYRTLFKPLLTAAHPIQTPSIRPSVHPKPKSLVHSMALTIADKVIKSMIKKTNVIVRVRSRAVEVSMWIRKAKEIIKVRENNVSSTILRALGGKIYASNSRALTPRRLMPQMDAWALIGDALVCSLGQ